MCLAAQPPLPLGSKGDMTDRHVVDGSEDPDRVRPSHRCEWNIVKTSGQKPSMSRRVQESSTLS